MHRKPLSFSSRLYPQLKGKNFSSQLDNLMSRKVRLSSVIKDLMLTCFSSVTFVIIVGGRFSCIANENIKRQIKGFVVC